MLATTDRRRQSPIADRRSTLGVPGVDDRLDVGRSSESPAAESSARTPASAASAAWPLTWESGIGNRDPIRSLPTTGGTALGTGTPSGREVDRARRKKVFSHVSFVLLTIVNGKSTFQFSRGRVAPSAVRPCISSKHAAHSHTHAKRIQGRKTQTSRRRWPWSRSREQQARPRRGTWRSWRSWWRS